MGKSRSEKAKSGLQDVFIYLAIFFVFYLLLKRMLMFAKKTINKIRPLPKIDDFIKRNGYTFEFCIVFCVYDESDVFTDEQAKVSMRSIIDRLANAGLDFRCFYSCQRDEIYVKIRAEPERLRAEASRINYRLLLDPDKLRAKAQAGKKRQGEWVWKSIVITDEFKVSRYNPYKYIYASYDANAYADGLYKLYPALENHKHVFTGLNRIELIISIMHANASLSPPGCGLNLDLLKAERQILASFPIHDYDQLNALQMKWLNLVSPPWKQPTDEIKDYFGHRIALYFLYLGHYVELLMSPALLGGITFIVQKVYYYPENFLMPWFAGYMVLWSTIYIELWKRKQSTAAMRWGSSGCEDEEQDRAVYKGERIKSPVNGQMITYFPPEDKANRATRALTAVITMIAGVISIVIGIYIFQYWINLPANRGILHIGAVNLTSVIASLINTVVVVVLNILYQRVAIRLNDYENHRTDTEYEDNLIAKIFSFQLVNTFAGLTYVSFVKRYLNIICTKDNCTGEVAGSLSTVFLTAMVTRALIQIFIRKFNQSRKEKKETSGLPPGVKPSSLEEQYILDEYPIIIGTLADYAGLTIQFGYTVLFVAAFPLAPTIALISGYIQIRIDGWKLCQAFQRPRPKTAEDIGMWQDMIEILGVIGVVYNFGLVFLTGHYLQNLTWQYRWIVFILVEHVTFLLKYIMSITIDDVPADVVMQLERQEYLVGKVIRNEADELDEEFVEKKSNMSFGITDFDDDYYEEGEQERISAVSPESPLISPEADLSQIESPIESNSSEA